MSFYKFLESLADDWPTGYWIDPTGKIYELDKMQTHWNWMEKNTKFDDIDKAFEAGWARMIVSGNDLYVHIEGNSITPFQRMELVKFCEKNDFETMLIDRGNMRNNQVIWEKK